MILPAHFIDSLNADTRDSFLEHLVLITQGADGYLGDLEQDKTQLLKQLRKGALLIEQFDDDTDANFGLITREQAVQNGYRPD